MSSISRSDFASLTSKYLGSTITTTVDGKTFVEVYTSLDSEDASLRFATISTILSSPPTTRLPSTSQSTTGTKENGSKATDGGAAGPSHAPSHSSLSSTLSPSTTAIMTTRTTSSGKRPTATRSSSTISVSPESTSIAGSSPTSTPSSPSLSKSAQIGLGVGISLGALLFMALGGFLAYYYLRRRKQTRKKVAGTSRDSYGIDRVPENPYGIDENPTAEIDVVRRENPLVKGTSGGQR